MEMDNYINKLFCKVINQNNIKIIFMLYYNIIQNADICKNSYR